MDIGVRSAFLIPLAVFMASSPGWAQQQHNPCDDIIQVWGWGPNGQPAPVRIGDTERFGDMSAWRSNGNLSMKITGLSQEVLVQLDAGPVHCCDICVEVFDGLKLPDQTILNKTIEEFGGTAAGQTFPIGSGDWSYWKVFLVTGCTDLVAYQIKNITGTITINLPGEKPDKDKTKTGLYGVTNGWANDSNQLKAPVPQPNPNAGFAVDGPGLMIGRDDKTGLPEKGTFVKDWDEDFETFLICNGKVCAIVEWGFLMEEVDIPLQAPPKTALDSRTITITPKEGFPKIICIDDPNQADEVKAVKKHLKHANKNEYDQLFKD